MKQVTINCEFSRFLATLAESTDSEEQFRFAKDYMYTYRNDDIGEDEITEEELIEFYHEEVEIQLLGMHYACTCCDLGLTFHKHCDLQFTLTCYEDNPVFTTFKTLYELLG